MHAVLLQLHDHICELLDEFFIVLQGIRDDLRVGNVANVEKTFFLADKVLDCCVHF